MMAESWQLEFGASIIGPDLGRFKVWAPFVKRMAVELTERDGSAILMQPSKEGHSRSSSTDSSLALATAICWAQKPGVPTL